MENKSNKSENKTQFVWMADSWGGQQVPLDSLAPQGKVHLWEKIAVLGTVSIIILIFLLMLYFLIF